ncbi:MAG: ATP-dependent DNA ligase, partial [Acidimicrobiia bacterium]|nr:ATP-dependent DNA ligase [Acidimicrobiia bacterium]
PHLAGRPLTVERYPNGVGSKGFFQKRVSKHYPPTLGRFRVATSKGPMEQPVLSTADDLMFLVNQAAITFHVPTSTTAQITNDGESGRPDRLVFDLDPAPGDTAGVRLAAYFVRDFLDGAGLVGHLMATGSKGFHVVVPIEIGPSYEVVGDFMHGASALVAHERPDALTTEFLIRDREGRVYLDWLRNRSAHATTVAPYSLRARPGAPAATPLTWDELADTPPDRWKLDGQIDERPDPWAGFEAARRSLEPALRHIENRLDETGIELVPFDRFGRSPQR